MAIDLVWDTFLSFEAPTYSAQGIEAFRQFIEKEDELLRLTFLGAYKEERPAGVLAVDREKKHLCLFFVGQADQRQGIGRSLWKRMCEDYDTEGCTVNASPRAVAFYQKIGFRATDTEQMADGIRYVPMIYSK